MGKNKKIQKFDKNNQYLLGIKKDEAEIKMYEKLLKIKKRKHNKKNQLMEIFKDFDPVSDEENSVEATNDEEMGDDSCNIDEESEDVEDLEKVEEDMEDIEDELGNLEDIDEELSDEEEVQSLSEEISEDVEKNETESSIPDSVKARIKRNILSHLNKLCESQMMKCLDAVEEIWEENPRGDVRDIFIKESMNYLNFSCLDMAAFVSCLHMRWLKRTNLIAFYMESLITRLTALDTANWEKESSVLATVTQGYKFIAYVTRLEVIDTNLAIDLMHEIIGRFEISRLKVVVEICSVLGFYIRKHNPSRCEDLVSLFRTKMNENIHGVGDLSEIQSLSDAIINKLTTSKAKNDVVFNNMVQYRKSMRTWCKNSVCTESVALRLTDFRGDNRVRWWLVGSALNPHLAHNKSLKTATTESGNRTCGSTSEKPLSDKEKQWNEVAQTLGFATAGKQCLFRALMRGKEKFVEQGDEDFVDLLSVIKNLSQSKPSGTGATGGGVVDRMLIVPEAEVSAVIVRCLMLEREFCPFYASLLCVLVEAQRQFRQLVKCAVWDVLQQPKLVDSARINIGKCLGQLIAATNFPVNCLRKYNFLDDSSGNIGFMVAVLSELLEESWNDLRSLIREMSQKISTKFVSNLRLFLKKHFQAGSPASEQISRAAFLKVNKSIDFVIELRKMSV